MDFFRGMGNRSQGGSLSLLRGHSRRAEKRHSFSFEQTPADRSPRFFSPRPPHRRLPDSDFFWQIVCLIVKLGVLGIAFLLIMRHLNDPRTTAFNQHRAQGDAACDQKNYKVAVREYSEMIHLRPDSPVGYLERGRAYYWLNQYGAAITDHTKALQLSSDLRTRADAYQQLGSDIDWAGGHRAAIAYFNKAIVLRPKIDDVPWETADADDGTMAPLKGRMWAYYHGKQYALAIQDCDALIARNASYVNNYGVRAKFELALGQHSQALADLNTTVQRDFFKTRAYDRAADVLGRQGYFADAVAQEEAAVRVNPQAGRNWGNLGWWQYRAGQVSQSIVSDQRALTLEGSKSSMRYNLGLAYATLGNWPQAKPVYVQALHQGTTQDWAGALGEVQHALQQQPHSAALQNALALLQRHPVS